MPVNAPKKFATPIPNSAHPCPSEPSFKHKTSYLLKYLIFAFNSLALKSFPIFSFYEEAYIDAADDFDKGIEALVQAKLLNIF